MQREVIERDVELSSLRMLKNQIISRQQYNIVTGDLEGFTLTPSQQILSVVEEDIAKISDKELDDMLAGI